MPEVEDDELFGAVPEQAPAALSEYDDHPSPARKAAGIGLGAIDPYAWSLGHIVVDEERAKVGPAVAVALPAGGEVLFHEGVIGPVEPGDYEKRVVAEVSDEDAARIQLLHDATAELPPEATVATRVQRIHDALEANGVNLL